MNNLKSTMSCCRVSEDEILTAPNATGPKMEQLGGQNGLLRYKFHEFNVPVRMVLEEVSQVPPQPRNTENVFRWEVSHKEVSRTTTKRIVDSLQETDKTQNWDKSFGANVTANQTFPTQGKIEVNMNSQFSSALETSVHDSLQVTTSYERDTTRVYEDRKTGVVRSHHKQITYVWKRTLFIGGSTSVRVTYGSMLENDWNSEPKREDGTMKIIAGYNIQYYRFRTRNNLYLNNDDGHVTVRNINLSTKQQLWHWIGSRFISGSGHYRKHLAVSNNSRGDRARVICFHEGHPAQEGQQWNLTWPRNIKVEEGKLPDNVEFLISNGRGLHLTAMRGRGHDSRHGTEVVQHGNHNIVGQFWRIETL